MYHCVTYNLVHLQKLFSYEHQCLSRTKVNGAVRKQLCEVNEFLCGTHMYIIVKRSIYK